MQWVAQALQLPVIVKWSGLHASEFQLPEKLDLFRTRITPEGGILEEGFEPRLFDGRSDGFPFHKLQSPGAPGDQAATEDYLHREGLQVDVPRFNQRVQERDAVVDRDVEDVR